MLEMPSTCLKINGGPVSTHPTTNGMTNGSFLRFREHEYGGVLGGFKLTSPPFQKGHSAILGGSFQETPRFLWPQAPWVLQTQGNSWVANRKTASLSPNGPNGPNDQDLCETDTPSSLQSWQPWQPSKLRARGRSTSPAQCRQRVDPWDRFVSWDDLGMFMVV